MTVTETAATDIVQVIGGVDTHKDTHTAAAVGGAGRLLGTQQFDACQQGYESLLAWLGSWGSVQKIGVEGTGSYGVGLTCFLQAHQVGVVEINRPNRRTRRLQGKSDPIDAHAAARTVLAGDRLSVPKDHQGQVEALRHLRVARHSAVGQRADVQRQLKTSIITAPEDIRQQLRELSMARLIATCAGYERGSADCGDPAVALRVALRALAKRHQQLSTEISELDKLITPLVTSINPQLIALQGVGPETAGQLLITMGDNPERITSEAGFAMLTGTAPLPASSGKTTRYRLNRAGDRQANKALHTIVLTRLRCDERTRAYMTRRLAEGKTRKEIIRCLKRYISREIYNTILTHHKSTVDTHGKSTMNDQ